MIDHDRWRDQQLFGFNLSTKNAVLAQEQVMLNFVTRFPGVAWKWLGNNTNFKNICSQYINIVDESARGVIIFGQSIGRLTSNELTNRLTKLLENFDYAYVGINRYELFMHDLNFDLPDSIEESLDKIMHHCNARFQRLHTFDQVDGNHMVAAHPMDCYGLCKL